MANELNADMLKVALKSIDDFAARELPDSLLIELDERDEFPEELVRRMSSGDELGIQLRVRAVRVRRHGRRRARRLPHLRADGARSTSASRPPSSRRSSGSDPIRVGGTAEQKREYMTRIAKDGRPVRLRRHRARGRQRPRRAQDGRRRRTNGGYRISGVKQWISNGGVADLYTILALAPGGPSWFVVEAGAEGFTHGEPEDKHGIRLSNTAALFLDNVYVDADRLIGGVEGQGLVQAQQVFGYTRLMVAAFGLGAGWAALDRAIAYSRKRIQAGGPLSEKQGYTHKLIVPHAVALEAARAAIEETAERHRRRRGRAQRRGRDRQVPRHRGRRRRRRRGDPGPRRLRLHARLHGREDQARRPHHAHLRGHLRDHGDDRSRAGAGRSTSRRGGDHYHALARELEALHAEDPDVGADVAALAHHALAELLERCRAGRLTRHQHILLPARRADRPGRGRRGVRPARAARGRQAAAPEGVRDACAPPALAAASRVYARDAALTVATEAIRLVAGADGGELGDLEQRLGLTAIHRAQAGLLADMQTVADALYARKRP